ncbi:hypothetical protein T4B_10466 [Trichinella pseudospiralis]|uniref:Uncharacterized protein n=1 Tax=Trichinella pseudospiralis TaxID=6337 RepID=A0A0V1GBE8_TRIPS|nr:hypothetical protein T4B_10466 [Trichinella pseudospiralis]
MVGGGVWWESYRQVQKNGTRLTDSQCDKGE